MNSKTHVNWLQQEYRRQHEELQQQQEDMEQKLQVVREQQRLITEFLAQLRHEAEYLAGQKHYLLSLSQSKIRRR